MLVDVAKNNLIENSDGNPNLEVKSYMKATGTITQVKVDKNLVKKANVVYAQEENDILNQEQIVKKSLEFFAEHYKGKVAGKKAG